MLQTQKNIQCGKFATVDLTDIDAPIRLKKI